MKKTLITILLVCFAGFQLTGCGTTQLTTEAAELDYVDVDDNDACISLGIITKGATAWTTANSAGSALNRAINEARELGADSYSVVSVTSGYGEGNAVIEALKCGNVSTSH
jgi:hypothetical protein